MRPAEEQLNIRLEQIRLHTTGQPGHHLSAFAPLPLGVEQDPEVEDLVALARHLRAMPQIQVDPHFAHKLEQRVILRSARSRLNRAHRKRAFFPLLRIHPALSAVLGCCLLFLVLSTGLLAFASQVSNPGNPLYSLKRWEQHIQISLAGDPAGQAALDLQFARESLRTLSSLADPAHAAAYEQALADLNQDLRNASSAIHELPAGTQRTQLDSQLTSFRLDAIHVLHGLLPGLALPERLATTSQLAFLGDSVSQLTGALLTLPAHPNGDVTISFSGSDLQSGAQLLVDGASIRASGTLQNGRLVFTLTTWDGARHPHLLGILNPDGTAVQTTMITVNTASGSSNGNSNGSDKNGNGGSSNGNGNGSGGNGNKPVTTPTPHH